MKSTKFCSICNTHILKQDRKEKNYVHCNECGNNYHLFPCFSEWGVCRDTGCNLTDISISPIVFPKSDKIYVNNDRTLEECLITYHKLANQSKQQYSSTDIADKVIKIMQMSGTSSEVTDTIKQYFAEYLKIEEQYVNWNEQYNALEKHFSNYFMTGLAFTMSPLVWGPEPLHFLTAGLFSYFAISLVMLLEEDHKKKLRAEARKIASDLVTLNKTYKGKINEVQTAKKLGN